jgi:hypothetical protein
MNQISIQLSSLPLNMVFIENGTIALIPQGNFNTLVDGAATFDSKGFSVSGVAYNYSVAIDYKNEPELLKYLQSLVLSLDTVYNAFQMEQQMRQHMGNFNFSF